MARLNSQTALPIADIVSTASSPQSDLRRADQGLLQSDIASLVHEPFAVPGRFSRSSSSTPAPTQSTDNFTRVPLRQDSILSVSRSSIAKTRSPVAQHPTIRAGLTSAPRQLQPKLIINQPGDKYEQEADRIADMVMRMPDDAVISPAPRVDSSPELLQRKCSACEDEEKKLRRSSFGEGPGLAPPIVNQVLGQPGRPMPESSRGFFERRMGADFSDVRIHDDPAAAASAAIVQAKAYTVGGSIAFAAGQFSPETSTGKKLLAHELTHVVQQRINTSRRPTTSFKVQSQHPSASEAEFQASKQSISNTFTPVSQSLPSETLVREHEDKHEGKKGIGDTIVGGLIGDFNEDPSLAEIGINTTVGLIPAVGEVTAARDVTANLYYMETKAEYTSPTRWLGLVFALISLFPEIGAALKGLGKALLKGVGEAIGPIVRLIERVLENVGHSEGVLKFFQENWNKVVSGGMSLFERVMSRISSVLTGAVTFVSSKAESFARGLAQIKDAAMKFLPEAFEKAKGLFENALERFGKKADNVEHLTEKELVGAGERGLTDTVEKDTIKIADHVESQTARETSVAESGRVESDKLTPHQIQNEIEEFAAHPEKLEGVPPNRTAQIGEHQWVEQPPGGRWCRHSIPVIPPVCAAVDVAGAEKATAKVEQQAATTEAVAPDTGKPPLPPPQSQSRYSWPGHKNAALAEEQLANTVQSLPDEAVVRLGDPIGAHGSDVISVNIKNGDVTLWDSKYRSGSVKVQPSKTFQEPARLQNAIREATETIENNCTLPANIKEAALRNLEQGRVKTRTVGAGNAKNSTLE